MITKILSRIRSKAGVEAAITYIARLRGSGEQAEQMLASHARDDFSLEVNERINELREEFSPALQDHYRYKNRAMHLCISLKTETVAAIGTDRLWQGVKGYLRTELALRGANFISVLHDKDKPSGEHSYTHIHILYSAPTYGKITETLPGIWRKLASNKFIFAKEWAGFRQHLQQELQDYGVHIPIKDLPAVKSDKKHPKIWEKRQGEQRTIIELIAAKAPRTFERYQDLFLSNLIKRRGNKLGGIELKRGVHLSSEEHEDFRRAFSQENKRLFEWVKKKHNWLMDNEPLRQNRRIQLAEGGQEEMRELLLLFSRIVRSKQKQKYDDEIKLHSKLVNKLFQAPTPSGTLSAPRER